MQRERLCLAGGARTGSYQSPARKRQGQAVCAGNGGPLGSMDSMARRASNWADCTQTALPSSPHDASSSLSLTHQLKACGLFQPPSVLRSYLHIAYMILQKCDRISTGMVQAMAS